MRGEFRAPPVARRPQRSIGAFASFVLTFNNITGVGLLALPIVFQQGGWLVTSLALLFFMVLAGTSAVLRLDQEPATLIIATTALGRMSQWARLQTQRGRGCC